MTDEELREALSELGDQEKFKDLEKDLKKLERMVYTYTDADTKAKGRLASAGGKETSSYRVAVRVKNDAKKRVNEEIARLEEKYGKAFSDDFLAGPKDLSKEELFKWFSANYFSARICAIPNMLSGFDLDTNQAALGAETMSHLFFGGSRSYSSPGFADQMEQAMQSMQPNYLRAPKMPGEQNLSSFDETEPKPRPNLPQDELGGANVEFVMKEMFRLNARMKRNSRGTKPLKELTEKLDALEQRYQAGPDLYRNMTRSELQKEMDTILNSVNEYIDAKSKQTSFSSTQLERLKCMNQLKSLRESVSEIAGTQEFQYMNERSGNPDYIQNALAEKLFLAKQVKSGNGKAMCNRAEYLRDLEKFRESEDFQLYAKATLYRQDMRPEQAAGVMLKQNGQKLLKDYAKQVEALKKADEAKTPAKAPNARKANEKKNGAVRS